MMIEDHRRVSFWQARGVGTAQVTRWSSVDLRERSKAVRGEAHLLCDRAAALHREAILLSARAVSRDSS